MTNSSFSVSHRDLIVLAGHLTAQSFELSGLLQILGAHQIEITHNAVPITGLPQHLIGTTIAQISDLHMSRHYKGAQLMSVVERINSLNPEFVMITGDYICEDDSYIEELIDPLNKLMMPAYAVLGNHDCWGNTWSICRALEQTPVRLLWNEAVEVSTGLWLVGLDDVLCGRPNLKRALEDVPADEPTLLMVHEPDYFTRVVHTSAPIDAQFSGHTHGGQIRLPSPLQGKNGQFLQAYILPDLGEQFVMGMYQLNGKILYTNRGLGFTGPPMRLNCRPEISMFRLYDPRSK